MTAPISTTRSRPILSARVPAKMLGMAPVNMMSETVKPSCDEESLPIEEWNVFIVVRAPMLPVSNPFSRPPKEEMSEAVMYIGINRLLLAAIVATYGLVKIENKMR